MKEMLPGFMFVRIAVVVVIYIITWLLQQL